MRRVRRGAAGGGAVAGRGAARGEGLRAWGRTAPLAAPSSSSTFPAGSASPPRPCVSTQCAHRPKLLADGGAAASSSRLAPSRSGTSTSSLTAAAASAEAAAAFLAGSAWPGPTFLASAALVYSAIARA